MKQFKKKSWQTLNLLRLFLYYYISINNSNKHFYMTVYQIKVKGQYKYFEGECQISSGKIYKHYPTEEEIAEFIKCCSETPEDNPLEIYDLDTNENYTVKILELELVD